MKRLYLWLACLMMTGIMAQAGIAQQSTRSDGASQLTTPPAPSSDQNPAFSPDSTQLVFTRFENGYNDGPSTLYKLDVASGAIQQLIPARDSDNVNLPGSSWNALTQRIVFSSDREYAEEIWILDPVTAFAQRVTYHIDDQIHFFEPSFSPDGQWIVFEMWTEAGSSIWKVRADGSQMMQLTDGTFNDRQPNWSPTGERIVFQRDASGNDEDWDLYTMTPDGTDIQQVTATPSSDTDASWSPDGQWLVYSSDYGGLPTPSLFVIPAQGGTPLQITTDPTRYDGAPSWSPDGQWIAFESHLGEDDAPTEIWRIAAPRQQTNALPALEDVTNWLYLIDVNLDAETIAQIVASDYDMVVLDFIPSEANNTDYPMAEVITQLHNAPRPKLVIAYIDTGQAEDYRTYWQDGWGIGNPEWIVSADPDGWEGNYPVAYWYDEWRAIWLDDGGYLQTIVELGFDGVYLDWVEAYSDTAVVEFAESDGVNPVEEMIWWVQDIADYTRALRPDFIVIAQNAAELAEYDEYIEVIDAIAQEQVWFDGGADNDPPGDCPLPRT
ncbi:MAG: hypothetical protein D6712_11090, partial [Chloroflexi bacterium]